LQAPYGYGKSILAAQWAERLEALRWRVIWLSALGNDVRALAAQALALPADIPWEVVSSALRGQPTLLVLEDLEEGTVISPVLQNVAGLVLLASRKPLFDPGLLKLLTLGRVTKLDVRDLAFDAS
jgi:hypothetical protein